MASIDFSANPSLNEIVSSLAARVNKPSDTGLMAELKHIVRYNAKAAIDAWIKDQGVSDYLMQTVRSNLIKVSASECYGFPTDCYIVRTECKIPNPYRDISKTMSHELFNYVGHISGYDPYSFLSREHLGVMKYKPYTSDKLKWFYSDQYIYIVNLKVAGIVPVTPETPAVNPPSAPETVGSVMIRSVFQDPMAVYDCNVCDTSGSVCEPDDAPYPLPPELLQNIVKSILLTELRSGDIPKDQTLNEDEIKVDSLELISHQNK